MTNGEETATQDLDQRIQDLEQQAKPQLEGLEESLTGAIWDNIKDFFMLLWRGRMEDGIEYTPELIGAITQKAGEQASDAKQALSWRQLVERINAETDPRAIVEIYEQWFADFPILNWLISIILFVSGLGMVILADTSATKEIMWQSVWKKVRPALLPMESIVAYAFKNPEFIDQMKEEITRYGYSDELIDILFASAEEKLSPEEARQSFLREQIDELEHDTVMKSHRYSDEAIQLRKKLYDMIPPVGDLITMAVREVFSPEIAEKFGQFEGYPEEFTEHARHQGITEEWAKRYWAAHWNLPSATQGFEMLHRGVIDFDELELLLRALDIMPFWRDRLTQISYNPLTRVDVRRMYDLGVLDEEGVLNSYLDLGYNQDNAELMTKFTVAYTLEHERNLTRTDITTLFKRGVLSQEETLQYLIDMGYSEDNAALLVARAIFERDSEIKDKKIEATKKLYVAGRITEAEVYSRLGKLDMPSAEQNTLLELWDLERAAKVRAFTFEQVKKMNAYKIINDAQTLDELQDLGYSKLDSDKLLQLIKKEGAG